MNSRSIYAYHVLRASLSRNKCLPSNLSDLEAAEIRKIAAETLAVETAILRTEQAGRVKVAPEVLDGTVKELEARYPTREAFLEELDLNHLDETILRQAVQRQLWVEATLEDVCQNIADPSDKEIEVFYQDNIERFSLPETREARHILITINADFPENTRENALERMTQIKEQVKAQPEVFDAFAQRYSECPTALNGGLLGRVKPGQLYDALDEVLFDLSESECSGVVETDAGFHVIKCEKIHLARKLTLREASFRIAEYIHKKKKERFQQEWISNIRSEQQSELETSKGNGGGEIASFIGQGAGG